MGSVKINEILLNQNTPEFSADDAALVCGEETEAVVVRNAFDSTQNLYIGWGSKPSMGNSIPPGTSIVYERVGSNLNGNALYIGFAGASGGKAVITEYQQTEIC